MTLSGKRSFIWWSRLRATHYLLGILLIIVNARAIFAYVTDTTIYTPPAYTTFIPPSAGGSYTDAVFGTAIKRLTNGMSMVRADNGATLTSVQTEYSTMSPFNHDNTRLLLLHFSYFGLYDGGGNYLRDLPLEINASSEPRWSRNDPNVFYYVRGNQLKQYNVGTGAISVLHTFSQYTQIKGNGESDISLDGDHLVLQGDGRVFVYTISTDAVGPDFDTTGHGFDSLYITPDNNVTITWNASGTSRYTGIELFDQNMSFLRQVARAGGHMDVTRDVNGDEVLIWTNSGDATPLANCPNGIVKIRLADAQQTCMLAIGWIGVAVHISAPDNAGWVLVETYAPSDPIPPSTSWKLYTNELLLVKLDGSEVRRIAHHRSRPFNSYTYMPRIAVNRQGTKAVYSSNYGLQGQLGYPSNYSDAYMIDLAATAPTVTTPSPAPPPTPTPTTTRVEETSTNVVLTGPWNNNALSIHSGSSAKLAMTAGYRATFSFTGTSAAWIAYTDQWSGFAKIYVDGTFLAEIDTYASPAKAQAKMYNIVGLSNGAHTLAVEVSGRRNALSGGNWVWVDAFESTTAVQPTPTQATINWSTPGDIVYGTPLSSAQLNATATVNGVPIAGTFVYSPAAGTILQAGSGQLLHVDFMPADTTLYTGASKEVTITVAKRSQTITFGSLPGKTLGDPAFSVSATASSNLAVTFFASGACTVTGSVVTLTGVGSCTIIAQQAGNANYLPAPNVSQSFTIAAVQPTQATINWSSPGDIVYGTALSSAQLNATATVNGVPIAGTFVYSPAVGTILQAGWGQLLHVDFMPADTTLHTGASKDVTITVAKRSQTITFGPLPGKTLGDPAFSVGATASSNLAVTFFPSGACTVTGSVVTITGVGLCTITAQQAGNANYLPAPNVSQSFTITSPVQATTQRIEQTSSAVQLSGAWSPNNLWAHSGHSARLAMNAGDRATLTFTGTGVTWIAYRDQWSGIARIYIDGILTATIDTYWATGKAQSPMYSVTGLPMGNHVLTIEATGQKNSVSAGRWIWVDAFDVTTLAGR
jgi:hypothetical protein